MRWTWLSRVARGLGFWVQPRSRPIRRSERPRLELLEDRNAPAVYRVNLLASDPTPDGSDWAKAFPSLQSAINLANAGDEIWVAQGTYTPTVGLDRTISFNLESGVGIYGGFAGTETIRTQRDAAAHVATLSGDIGVLGDNSDNSYHVLYGSFVNNTAVLDGFTISGGNANDTATQPNSQGGGIYLDFSSPRLTSVTLSGNSASYGGGISNHFSSPTLTNATLSSNSAGFGGAIYTVEGAPRLTNVTLSGNSASFGGGSYNYFGAPRLTNVTLSGNSADFGGGIDNDSGMPELNNVILWGNTAILGASIYDDTGGVTTANYSDIQGGWAGVGSNNINVDPRFAPLANYGGPTQTMALLSGSPAIDAGTNSGAPATDQRGVARYGLADMGAFEANPFVVTITTDETSDNGLTSLREAIAYANSNPGPDTITFDSSVAGGTFNLDSLLSITSDVTIDGAGEIIQPSGANYGAFSVSGAGSALAMDHLTIRNFHNLFGGGAIDVAADGGALVLDAVNFLGDSANGDGGAIRLQGGTGHSITNGLFQGNSTPGAGGAIYVNPGAGNTVNIASSTFGGPLSAYGNSAGGSGGAINLNSGTLSLTDSTLQYNTASGYGGGLMDGGGSFYAANSTFANNTGGASAMGGGIFNAAYHLNSTVINCTFANNIGRGAGIGNSDTLTVIHSTFANNVDNTVGYPHAGGIFSYGTISLRSNLSVQNTGGDLGNYGTISTALNNLVAVDNTSSLTDGVDGNIVGSGVTFAGLAPLGDYGGPTQTMALLPGSQAIGAGAAGFADPAGDQRGFARAPTPNNPNIGAFESRGFSIAVTSGNDQSTQINTAFAAPLVGTVSSAYGEPVAGGKVIFTPPASGASATLTGSPATIAADGTASVSADANGTIGANYTVGASASGASSAFFTLSNKETPSLVVTTITDVADDYDGLTSLREAIAYANSHPGDDTITFAPGLTGAINLSTSEGGHGTLVLNTNVTIDGAGATIIIEGGSVKGATSNAQVLNTLANVTLNDLTIRNAYVTGYGAGLWNQGALTITNCTFSGNTAAQLGGAFGNRYGTVTVTNSTFADNVSGWGGALYNESTITVTNSTIANNSNGGILNYGWATLTNTVLATNTVFDFSGIPLGVGSFNNLIQVDDGSGLVNGINGNIIGAGVTFVGLGSLGNYGGPTQTMALLPGSQAINAGTSGVGIPLTDQRGIARVGATDIGAFESRGFSIAVASGDNQRTPINTPFALPLAVSVASAYGEPVANGKVIFADPPALPGAAISGSPATIAGDGSASVTATANGVMGAYLVTASANGANSADFTLTNTETPSLVVTTTDDVADDYDGLTSLREAIAYANSKPGDDTITFAVSGTITLGSGLPTLFTNIAIQGPSGGVTVDANNGHRVFTITAGANVSIDRLTIAHGSEYYGGGIYVSSSTLALTNSTVVGNLGAYGGGLYNAYGTVTITNSTFAGNTATAWGGGVYSSYGSVTLTNCTVAGNTNWNGGGGVFQLFGGGPVSLANTIVAGNNGGDFFGTVSSLGYNLVGSTSGSGGWLGTDLQNVNPLLTPLGNYGGPTQTMALLPGSPAINGGINGVGIPNYDQRGIYRDPGVDIGAFESRGFNIAVTSGDNQRTLINTPFALPLAVSISSSYGEPVAGGQVTFADPPALPGAVITGSPATIAGDGSASVTATANGTIGTYGVTARTRGTGAANFTLTNTETPSLVVTTIDDIVNDTDGVTSLREAIVYANSKPGDDTIIFAVTGTITLDNALPGLASNINMQGPGAGSLIVERNSLSAGNFSVFTIPTGNTVGISGLTISGGSTVYGGGIYNAGNLSVNAVTFSNNAALWGGGGIFVDSTGTTAVTNCTFTSNTTTSDGGAVYNNDGALTLTNSTLAGNHADGNGGAVFVPFTATATILNTIIAHNTAASGPDIYCYGLGVLAKNTLFGTSGGLDLYPGSQNNIFFVDPLLAPLGNYAGPTQTMALLPGSPAINAGVNGPDIPTTDQRGIARDAWPDIGAFESRGFHISSAAGDLQSAQVNTWFTDNLQVSVWSENFEPVSGGVVTFTGPASGASTEPRIMTATIDDFGLASVSAQANSIYGLNYTVSASGNGILGSADFTLSNTDGTPPEVNGIPNDGAGADIDYQKSLTTLSANWAGVFADPETGIAGYEWAAGTSPGGEDLFTFTTAGVAGDFASRSDLTLVDGQTYFVTVRASNGAGMTSTAETDGVTVDDAAPTTGASPDAAPNANGWNNTDVTVTLTPSDVGSGVQATYYTVNGGSTQTGTSIPLSADSFFDIAYWSTDQVGNVEPTNSLTVRIDKIAPDTTFTSTPPAMTDHDSATFVWTGADNLSGVDRYEYSLDGAAFVSTANTTATFNTLAMGPHTFQVRSVDSAGNTDATPASFNWQRIQAADDFSGSTMDPAWIVPGGAYTLSGGAFVGTDPNVYPTTNIAIYSSVSLTDAWVQVDINLASNQGAGLIARYQSDGRYYLGMIHGNGTNYTAYLFRYNPGAGFTQLGAAPVVASGTGTLRLEVVGTEQKLFFGPSADSLALVTYAHDGVLTNAGLFGVRSTQNATLDNYLCDAITLTTPALTFNEPFTQGNGAQLSRNWTEQAGNFSVAGNALVANDPNTWPTANIATVHGVSLADVAVQTDITVGSSQSAGLVARYQANGSYYLGMIYGSGGTYLAYLFRYAPSTGFVQLNTAVPTVAADAGTLRLEVVGSSLKLFFGPDADHLSLVTYAQDGVLTAAGLAGIRAYRNVMLDNFSLAAVVAPPPPTLPFTDSFTQPTGSQLSGNWTERNGNFGIAGNALEAHDPNVYPYTNIATVNGVSLANVAVQANVIVGVSQGAGLIARYQSDGSYYLGMINAAGGTFTPYLFRYTPTAGFVQLNTPALGVATGAGLLRLEVAGTSLKLYFGPDSGDLSLLTSAIDAMIPTAGFAGVRARQNVTIDNFFVDQLP